jgi:NDP-sugar pyrophosphorylase family protein
MKTSVRAAILCGGRGERLKPLTDYYQKTMIPVGPKKLPILAYIVALLKHHRISKVAFLTGYRAEEVKRYFGDGSEIGMKFTYSEDKKGTLGSLNAVANALTNGAIPRCDELLVYYGDILTDLDITALFVVHRKEKADVTLVLGKGYSLPVGVADVKGARVISFHEKPKLNLSVTTGMMVMGPKAMALIKKVAGPRKTDLMADFVPELLRSRGRVAPFYLEREWYDVGTVGSFEKLNEGLARNPLNDLI